MKNVKNGFCLSIVLERLQIINMKKLLKDVDVNSPLINVHRMQF